jgi:hypothetical protein
MMTATIPPRPAARLTPGDRIAAGFLPPTWQPAEVLLVHEHEALGDRWAFVAYLSDDGTPAADHFLADKHIPLEAVADPTGAEFSDLADRLAGESAPVPAGADVIRLGRDAGKGGRP